MMNVQRVLTRILGYLLFYSGIISLIRFINGAIPRIPIITYHSICADTKSESKSIFNYIGMEVPKAVFEKHIRYITRRYNVIGLDELVDWKLNKKELPKNPIVITFDDGLKNNYDNAFPVLRKYGCKATFFLIGSSYTAGGIVWLHLLYRVLDILSEKEVKIDIDNVFKVYIKELTEIKKIELAIYIKDKTDKMSENEKLNILKIICSQNRIDFQQLENFQYYMNEYELKDLIKHGDLLGAHSMTHDNLAAMPYVQMEKEVILSGEVIKKICENDFMPFSYPFGTKMAFNDNIKKVLSENGYSCAVTTLESLNSKATDLFELYRIEIGNFDLSEFVIHTCGVIGDLKVILKKLLKRN